MKTVGLRELKNRLAEYVRQVQGGEEILVTDRGKVVAELRPPFCDRLAEDPHPVLSKLARQGKVRLGGRNKPASYPKLTPILPPGSAQELLDEERGDR